MSPSDDLSSHLHGEDEIPIRDIISRFITLGFMLLSIVALAVLLGFYAKFPALRSTSGKLIMSISITLMIALFFYAIGVLAIAKIWYPMCFIMAVSIHFNFLASLAFASCLSFDLWKTNQLPKHMKDSKLFFRYSLFSWTFSGLIVLFSVIVEFFPVGSKILPLPRPRYSMPVAILHPSDFHTSQYHEHSVWVCWIMNHNALLMYLNLPGALLIAVSSWYYFKIIQKVATDDGMNSRKRHGTSLIRRNRRLFIYLKLSMIITMTWLFGFIAAATNIEAFWIPFGLTYALQGFYLMISFVFTKKVAKLVKGWANQTTILETTV